MMITTYNTRVQVPDQVTDNLCRNDPTNLKPLVSGTISVKADGERIKSLGGLVIDVQGPPATSRRKNKNIKHQKQQKIKAQNDQKQQKIKACHPSMASSKTQKNTKNRVYSSYVDCSNKPKKPSKMLSCKKTSRIGTFNCRTLRKDHKIPELIDTFENKNIDILGLQEHRKTHDEEISITRKSKSYIITTSAWRNDCGAATGGVGFALTDKAYKAITDIKSISQRILSITFDGNPKLTIITVYSPTEGTNTEAAENFHDDLRTAINQIPAHNFVMVVGDMNAHLSSEGEFDPRWYHHQTTNRNGRLLRDTLDECQLEATNHRFQKRPGKLWTFQSDATLTKTQIDYILIRKKWKNSVNNTEPYNYFHSIGSDHRAVLSDIRLSLRKAKTPPRKINYDWDEFKQDNKLQALYSIEVKNRFANLELENDTVGNATASYNHFVTAVGETSEKLLPKRKKTNKINSATDSRVIAARTKLTESTKKYHLDPSAPHLSEVNDYKNKLEDAYTEVEEEILDSKIRKVENAAEFNRTKESWNLINEISGRKKATNILIKGGSSSDRIKTWQNHFQKLLGQPPLINPKDPQISSKHTNLDIDTEPFTKAELELAKKKIKEGKACGEDGITPEVLKRCDLDDIVLQFCNQALEQGIAPDQWGVCNIIPVPKKGDLTSTDNYRGIALTSIIAKTLNRMILNRIQPEIEIVLRDNQNGFRAGRSTTSHILTLRRVLEGARKKNLPATMLFIDFKKAFDSIHRGVLMKILLAYGIPNKIVDLIDLLYSKTKAQVLTPDGLTEIFDILAGVMQGDTLAPYLFIIVIDYCMTEALIKHPDIGFTITPAQSRRIKAIKLADTEFADDIALLTDSIVDMQALLSTLEEEAAKVGLHMNEKKTNYMLINQEDQPIKTLNGTTLEKKEDFLYLGSWMSTTEKDINVRKAKAWAACHKLRKVWKSKLSNKLKTRLFLATVESVLLYGSEAWTLTDRLNKILDGCYTRMLRMALDITVSHTQHVSNAELYGNLPKLSSKIAQRRLRFAGHCHRHQELTSNRVLFWEPTHGKANKGRPHITYPDTLCKDTGTSNKNINEVKSRMENRELWRVVVDSVRVLYKHPP